MSLRFIIFCVFQCAYIVMFVCFVVYSARNISSVLILFNHIGIGNKYVIFMLKYTHIHI